MPSSGGVLVASTLPSLLPSGRGNSHLARPAPLVKQQSEGTLRLAALRRRLEELESKKLSFGLDEEKERKALREEVQIKFEAVRTNLDERVEALQRCLDLLGPGEIAGKKSAAKLASEPAPNTLLSSARDAALAVALVETIGAEEMKTGPADRLARARRAIASEIHLLNRQKLAAKVMANVSLLQKKLLNLSHSWLRTFVPHCLGKINRVSFGLLTEEDCAAVLEEDPMVPRSRLKLAVPFVGKDVPSSSSEFAHPDIIIGLTVLAYRYSGLRRTDFNDVIDGMTSEFSHEIGPARDRPSSRRHEMWVVEAKGSLRGIKSARGANNRIVNSSVASGASEEELDEREVVQLKFLSKTNEEQMGKLFELWRLEPLVLHYYLQKYIFPAYMRHQCRKISASGQAVGGDMLFARRVGFSGTPSDLLPKELGKCSYETGDDGKMLSTVLDCDVASYEHLPEDWSVEGLLTLIATSELPRYHALIDTGALITGYSNLQVAKELLARGLTWCDGIVFLDENDKQNVLVRDTGRVVSADQCGVPLERRFAFYDQIHTTGMDIQHVVNATACITLGKDMVFRDFVQGAYRMRGIGLGQTIRVFVIPEVKELMERELKASDVSAATGDLVSDAVIRAAPGQDRVLVEIVAWLVINSMRSEMTQWSMLCLQSVTNVFRKTAYRKVLAGGLAEARAQTGGSHKELLGAEETAPLAEALQVFDEPIDFTLDSTVPDPVPFIDKLRSELEENAKYIETPEQQAVADEVVNEVAASFMTDGRTMDRLDSEQEREQEQEQEKEVRSKREQEIEVEKFVDREYTRSDEAARAWHLTQLLEAPVPVVVGSDGTTAQTLNPHPFSPLSDFKLRYGEPLRFPSFLGCSRNYFNPTWTGLRRVKNVVCVLEYVPNTSALRLRGEEETYHDAALYEERSKEALAKAFTLLATADSTNDSKLNPDAMVLSRDGLGSAIRAATDVSLSSDELDVLSKEFGDANGNVGRDGLKRLLTSGRVRTVENGRYFVALSLAEAETLRRVIHMQKPGQTLLSGSTANPTLLERGKGLEVALRYVPMQSLGAGQQVGFVSNASKSASSAIGATGLIFDTSLGWRDATGQHATRVSPYQLLSAHTCMRFLDCAQHYTDHALNVLVRSLQKDEVHARELFYLSTVAARRRLERRWQETPLAKVFTLANEWMVLKHHAQAVFIRRALESKRMTLWEAFLSFDFNDDGVLGPAEMYGAMRFLGLPNVSADDVVDMIEAADRNDDGVVDYREYLELVGGDDEQAHGHEEDSATPTTEDEAKEDAEIHATKVEPYGADALREIMSTRRREKGVRQRQDRARRTAFQQALDIKVFEAELRASRDRPGGPNPRVLKEDPHDPASARTTIFRFDGNDAPIRMVPSGKWKFSALRNYHTATKTPSMTCSEGHDLLADSRYWSTCVMCSRQNTTYRCMECNGYTVCMRCYTRWIEEARKKAEDITDKVTYAHVFGGCSFSLQVPSLSLRGMDSLTEEVVDHDEQASQRVAQAAQQAAAQANTKAEQTEDPDAVEPKSLKAEEGAPLPAQALEVNSQQYSVTLELRVERLPPKGHSAALLRFSPATHGRSRSRHLASVYLSNNGRVVSAAKAEGTEAYHADAAHFASTPPSVMKPNVWHVVTITVDAERGRMLCYVDGRLSSVSEGLDQETLTLRHQIVVLGGGKQAQTRGGHLRRLLIHDRVLSHDQVRLISWESKGDLDTRILWFHAADVPTGLPIKKELEELGFHIETVDSGEEKDVCDKCDLLTKSVVISVTTKPIVLRDEKAKDASQQEASADSEGQEVPEEGTELVAMKSIVATLEAIRKVHPYVVCIVDASCMTGPVVFKVGERVFGRYRSGARWYPGRITRAHDDGTYDLGYDDGDVETRVTPATIKSTSSLKLTPFQAQLRSMLKGLPGVSMSTTDLGLRELIFRAETDYNQARVKYESTEGVTIRPMYSKAEVMAKILSEEQASECAPAEASVESPRAAAESSAA